VVDAVLVVDVPTEVDKSPSGFDELAVGKFVDVELRGHVYSIL